MKWYRSENIVYGLVVLLTVGISTWAFYTSATVITWGDAGSLIAALVSVPGVFFIVKTFEIQREQNLDADIHKELELICESIDMGLSNLATIDEKHSGVNAIHRHATYIHKRQMKLKAALDYFEMSNFVPIVAGLMYFIDWLGRDVKRNGYYSIYLVRYAALMQSLKMFMPSTELEEIKRLKQTYSPDQYHFFVAMIGLLEDEEELELKTELYENSTTSESSRSQVSI